MKNCNMILIERPQKYQLYHQAKLINMNILLGKKSIQQQTIEQAKFTYSPLEIKYKDQGKKQVDALVALKPKEIKPRETKPN